MESTSDTRAAWIEDPAGLRFIRRGLLPAVALVAVVFLAWDRPRSGNPTLDLVVLGLAAVLLAFAVGLAVVGQRIAGPQQLRIVLATTRATFVLVAMAGRSASHNLAFRIGLRRKVEHHRQPHLDDPMSGGYLACALNFEYWLTTFFGPCYGVGDTVAIAIRFRDILPADACRKSKSLAGALVLATRISPSGEDTVDVAAHLGKAPEGVVNFSEPRGHSCDRSSPFDTNPGEWAPARAASSESDRASQGVSRRDGSFQDDVTRAYARTIERHDPEPKPPVVVVKEEPHLARAVLDAVSAGTDGSPPWHQIQPQRRTGGRKCPDEFFLLILDSHSSDQSSLPFSQNAVIHFPR